MNLCECHFTYNNTDSRKYNLIIANIETEMFRPIVGVKKGNYYYNKASKSRCLIGDDYSDTSLEIEIEIVTCDASPLKQKEIREVERWLFTNSIFRKLYIDMDDDYFGEMYELVYGVQKRLYFNCRFMSPTKIYGNGGIIGFKCILETDSMMLWQDPIVHAFDVSKDPITINDGGETRRILLGDINMNGRLEAIDAQNILMVYLYTIMHEEDPDYDPWVTPRYAFDPPLSKYQLIACDMDYTSEDYDNDTPPNVQAIDAQRVLILFLCDVLSDPVPMSTIIILDDGSIVVVDEGTKVIDVPVDTDLDGYTYPEITLITGKTGGDIEITNLNDNRDRVTKFANVPPYSRVVIDSSISRVSDGLYEQMTKKNFPRLISGENKFAINGDVTTMSVSWQNRRFL